MYVIYKGKVKIHDEDHIYDHLETGDCFGEYALIDEQKRSEAILSINGQRYWVF